MAGKESGLGDNFYVDQYNLSGDTNSLQKIAGPQATLDFQGVDKFAFERQGGKRDGEITWTSYFNAAVGQAHPALSALPTVDRLVSYFHGTGLGNWAAVMPAKQINYDPNRSNDGSLLITVQALANGYAQQWGRQATAGVRSDTTGTVGGSVDQTVVSTSFGWQAYLHCFSFTGTSFTATIKDSADNSSFAVFTGSAFAAQSAPGTQSLLGASNATVRRYVRVETTGTFSQASFAIVFVRNETATVF